MPLIDWTDGMAIGIDPLDADHRALLGHFNELHQAVADAWPTSAALAAGDTLIDALHVHFRQEEQLLHSLTLPDGICHREEHLLRHEEFLDRATALRAELAAGRPNRKAIESLAVSLTDFELVRFDFQMVGHLLREGLLLVKTASFLPA
ncbi:putative Hemerythrin [Magnetospirillum sp. LM-5]|uniref:bacteriohemerythrin n=1 Tax=Magnetospirillum sp. LM-5 TaxID=2681466 RepID=UPI001383CE7A|nr:hemerythrin domain-containing protein [Magnetospirillum sp. LM-5]CAA7612706.1 putative Hemerythrin [Magnetospirillum sp. LM-5]